MLSNKIVVVTGGAGLVGQEFIKAIIENNGTAIIADINESAGVHLRQQLSTELNTGKIDYVQLDITDKNLLSSAIEKVDDEYGQIDALVNNAYPRNPNYGNDFFDVEYDDFKENLGNNLGGYFLTSQQFANYFRQQSYGNIINISSIYGVIAPRFEIYQDTAMTTPVEYAAIKSGLIHLTKFMAKYFKGMNIRVNTISPGGIFNHQNERFLAAYNNLCLSKGMLEANDLTGTLVYLLSDLSHFVNGQNIIVDDGFTL